MSIKPNILDQAQAAYEGYCAYIGNGVTPTPWDDLSHVERNAWQAAVGAARKHLLEVASGLIAPEPMTLEMAREFDDKARRFR